MNQEENNHLNEGLIAAIQRLLNVIVVLTIIIVLLPVIILNMDHISRWFAPAPAPVINLEETTTGTTSRPASTGNFWTAPAIETITDSKQQEAVTYGKELIAHTSKYLGPNGSVMQVSNGLNCQNCHLQAGTAVFGNNFGSVASLYPKFRARSGKQENIIKRVNDCFERSLDGKALDSNSKEMQAIVAYINFVGSNVDKGKKAEGSGLKDLAYLDRAADPAKGQLIYTATCQSCHQENGAGVLTPDKTEYSFPALWGNNSFNDGAGLFRLGNFARYIKYNMPQGATHENPQLSDEAAWDVAAYVLSQPRPHLNTIGDWPDITKKPVDHPFGPYADPFTEKQHKFGPFKPIEQAVSKKQPGKKPLIASNK